MADVDVERSFKRRGLALMQGRGDFIAGDNAPRRARQQQKDIEFEGGEIDRFVIDPGFAKPRIDAQRASADSLFLLFGVAQRRSTARMRASSSPGSNGLGR